MDEVISQAPENISKEIIEAIFLKNNEDVIDTLVELWNIDVPKKPKKNGTEGTENGTEASEEDSETIDINNIKDHNEKWEAIRNICDAYDIEMQAQMNMLKNRKQESI